MTQTGDPITRRELNLAIGEQSLKLSREIADLATGVRHDLDSLRTHNDLRFDRLDRELTEIRNLLLTRRLRRWWPF